ncbi:MAG: DoxX family protein [Rhizonema sp. PD38]|nr:DoxX family protein [Rhizonema sp. PD38]
MLLHQLTLVLPKLLLSHQPLLAGLSLLLLRVCVGVAFILHGYPKLMNFTGWSKSIQVPAWLGFISANTMILGGCGLISGLLTPIAAFLIGSSMVVAIGKEIAAGLPFVALDPNGIAPPLESPAWEKAALYLVACLVLTFLGPGIFAIDHVLFR